MNRSHRWTSLYDTRWRSGQRKHPLGWRDWWSTEMCNVRWKQHQCHDLLWSWLDLQQCGWGLHHRQWGNRCCHHMIMNLYLWRIKQVYSIFITICTRICFVFCSKCLFVFQSMYPFMDCYYGLNNLIGILRTIFRNTFSWKSWCLWYFYSNCTGVCSHWSNSQCHHGSGHYNDVIMGAMTSHSTSLTFVYSTACSGADQRKHQSSASLDFVYSPHKWPVTRRMFPFDDVIMYCLIYDNHMPELMMIPKLWAFISVGYGN